MVKNTAPFNLNVLLTDPLFRQLLRLIAHHFRLCCEEKPRTESLQHPQIPLDHATPSLLTRHQIPVKNSSHNQRHQNPLRAVRLVPSLPLDIPIPRLSPSLRTTSILTSSFKIRVDQCDGLSLPLSYQQWNVKHAWSTRLSRIARLHHAPIKRLGYAQFSITPGLIILSRCTCR